MLNRPTVGGHIRIRSLFLWHADAGKDALEGGDGNAVVGDGDARFPGAAYARAHEGRGGNAGAAMDYQAVRRKVFREIVAGGDIDFYISYSSFQQRGNLDPADVLRSGDMGKDNEIRNAGCSRNEYPAFLDRQDG